MTACWACRLAAIVAVAALFGCSEVESTTAPGYAPAKLHEVEGSDVKRVTLTPEGARRTGLRTAAVQRSGDGRVIPYSALLYDGEGRTFVYTARGPLSFLRVPVVVDRVEGDQALLRRGPAAGTRIVTTGTVEVYGSELEIGGSH